MNSVTAAKIPQLRWSLVSPFPFLWLPIQGCPFIPFLLTLQPLAGGNLTLVELFPCVLLSFPTQLPCSLPPHRTSLSCSGCSPGTRLSARYSICSINICPIDMWIVHLFIPLQSMQRINEAHSIYLSVSEWMKFPAF